MEEILALLNDGIKNGLYSGAQVVVSDPERIVSSLCVGTTRLDSDKSSYYHPSLNIDENTLFDIASLTKPIATASLVMKAVDDQLLNTDQKLVSIPNINFPSWLLGNTIAQLLSHQTMLPAWTDFHGKQPRVEDHRMARIHVEREILRMEPRIDGKSWCYSDIGYILLGFILEDLYQKPLDTLFCDLIARPLGMQDRICYCPLHHCAQKQIAATSFYGQGYLQGHPDDSNARVLTHVAGHAGLFASARAVDSFVRALLDHQFPCRPETISEFMEYRHSETPFALGWDRPTSDDSLSGRGPGEHVIGHLGFTGCSVWIDLDRKRIVTMLTNRVHCCDDPKALGPVRRSVHRLCWGL